jgi:hypothetical protein
MLGYGIEETEQLCAYGLPFWSLMYDQLNYACKRTLTYRALIKKKKKGIAHLVPVAFKKC